MMQESTSCWILSVLWLLRCGALPTSAARLELPPTLSNGHEVARVVFPRLLEPGAKLRAGVIMADEPPRYSPGRSKSEMAAPYPPSTAIADISFEMDTLKEFAPGSDNWAITWADDGHQYTTWGDGGGFGGTNADGRVSMGIARVEGSKDKYTGYNVWGGKAPEVPATFTGKSYGILSIAGVLYLWRGGEGSDAGAFKAQKLYRSTDHGRHWTDTGVQFDPDMDSNSHGIFCPTFLQFGRDYAGARDRYVYSYGPEIQDRSDWNVQKPGKIALMRVPADDIEDQSKYEFFAGFDDAGTPEWTVDYPKRTPVFTDAVNGVMRTSVSYNAGLKRYFLMTQQVNRFRDRNGHIGIYDAPEPWGPWTTVLFANAWSTGLQNGAKTVYWNFSNKWLSRDGRRFVLVYTGDGPDNWATVKGTFSLHIGNEPAL